MKYRISGNLEPVSENDLVKKDDLLLEIMTVEELEKRNLADLPHVRTLKENLDPVRFCKSESFGSCIIGTLKIPIKPDVVKNSIALTFYLQGGRLLFVTKDSEIQDVVKSVREMKTLRGGSVGMFFYEFLQYFIREDVSYLVKYEDMLFALEDRIFAQKTNVKDNLILFQNTRRNALRMATYYQQMIDMLGVLTENENRIFTDEECIHFRILSERFQRLYDLTATIRDYCLQLRELQQENIQIRQNTIMQTLTVITAIFLPLTLLVGWYGMNFKYMPELDFRYGYFIIFIISVIIVAGEIIFFRKKHFLD